MGGGVGGGGGHQICVVGEYIVASEQCLFTEGFKLSLLCSRSSTSFLIFLLSFFLSSFFLSVYLSLKTDVCFSSLFFFFFSFFFLFKLQSDPQQSFQGEVRSTNNNNDNNGNLKCVAPHQQM